jgi:predicted aspartyl protease
VEAVLNGSLTTTFILDTGAGKTLINPETARSLNLDVGPATPALVGRVAGGSVVAFPVVYLDSLALGEAVVEDLGVLVGQGPQLLGMDVLEQFHYRIDPASEVLILKPRSRLQPGELRGGHPRAWWERKFSFLGERIRQEEALLEELESRLKVLPPGPDRVEVIHLRRKVAERLEGWRQRLRALEYRAAEALVPLDWRSLP